MAWTFLTVQNWLGHTDIESTMRYLKPSRSKEAREKVTGGTISVVQESHGSSLFARLSVKHCIAFQMFALSGE
jgi:hypothetical protein